MTKVNLIKITEEIKKLNEEDRKFLGKWLWDYDMNKLDKELEESHRKLNNAIHNIGK
ncbi:MAG: hypothetical protein M0R17_05935 [Candidatus Omnitrophica bacterium]|jgi:ABC-type Fe3+ transport system substrate-binding protein|nr:hypothetical protein [Candidatus Omnitrophota bacterium]